MQRFAAPRGARAGWGQKFRARRKRHDTYVFRQQLGFLQVIKTSSALELVDGLGYIEAGVSPADGYVGSTRRPGDRDFQGLGWVDIRLHWIHHSTRWRTAVNTVMLEL